MKPSRLVLIAGLALTAGAADAPTATLVLTKGNTIGLGYASTQTFVLAEPTRCQNRRQLAALLWTTANSKSRPVAAESQVVVLAWTTYFFSAMAPSGREQVTSDNKTCSNAARFTPLTGHTYEVVHRAPFTAASCSMTVVDRETGAAPPDLKLAEYASCAAFEDAESPAP